MDVMKQPGPWSSLSTHASGGYVFPVKVKPKILTFKAIGILTKVFCPSGPNLVILAWTDDKLWCGQAQNGDEFKILSNIWPWRSRSIALQNNRDLNQGLLHICSKFGDPSLYGWRVIARTNLVTDGRTHTDRRRQREYPETKTGLG